MKSLLLWTIAMAALLSCKSKKDSSENNSNIASITHNAEVTYLKNTITSYSGLSGVGRYYWEQDSMLDMQISELKKEFKENGSISSKSQDSLFNHFGTILKAEPSYLNSKTLLDLKNQPINKASDIDLLDIYFKQGFVAKLNGIKLLPFDMWSVMATVDKWKIKNGEEFRMQMNTTAANSTDPAEWYILKDAAKDLTKDNIVDTLHPGEFGETTFKTRAYRKGINQILVAVKLKTAHGEQIVYRTIEFTVE